MDDDVGIPPSFIAHLEKSQEDEHKEVREKAEMTGMDVAVEETEDEETVLEGSGEDEETKGRGMDVE